MIQSYDQIDKLDSNAMSKLTFVLLHREFQLFFLKDQYIWEEKMKKEVSPDSDDLNSISEASCMHTKEVENKRRSFWIESMKMFLVMSRELIKQSEPVKKNKQYSFSTNENYECVLCDEQHIDKGVVLLSLSRCPMFREMNVENRISAVDQNDFCRKCLRDKDDGQHSDGCKVARERNIICRKCDPPSTFHHPMIHSDNQVWSNSDEQNYFSSNPDDDEDDDHNDQDFDDDDNNEDSDDNSQEEEEDYN